jgi:predicted flavoprotein YhiN
MSGPATLRLSAFAAREFHAMKYKCDVNVHFCPKWEEQQRGDGAKESSESILTDELWKMTQIIPKRKVSIGCPLFMKEIEEGTALIPKRLWQALVQHSSISQDITWGDTSKAMIRSLASILSSFSLTVTGKGSFKEEFVTAGGIHLKEVDMTNMESKIVPGLFMCGEVLDVDGVTGGFNFMGCWSTGFVAGEGAAEFCVGNAD